LIILDTSIPSSFPVRSIVAVSTLTEFKDFAAGTVFGGDTTGEFD